MSPTRQRYEALFYQPTSHLQVTKPSLSRLHKQENSSCWDLLRPCHKSTLQTHRTSLDTPSTAPWWEDFEPCQLPMWKNLQQSVPAEPCAITSTDSSVKLQPACLNLTHNRNCTVKYSLKCRELDLHMNGYLNRVSVFWRCWIRFLTWSVFVLLKMPYQHNKDSNNYNSQWYYDNIEWYLKRISSECLLLLYKENSVVKNTLLYLHPAVLC